MQLKQNIDASCSAPMSVGPDAAMGVRTIEGAQPRGSRTPRLCVPTPSLSRHRPLHVVGYASSRTCTLRSPVLSIFKLVTRPRVDRQHVLSHPQNTSSVRTSSIIALFTATFPFGSVWTQSLLKILPLVLLGSDPAAFRLPSPFLLSTRLVLSSPLEFIATSIHVFAPLCLVLCHSRFFFPTLIFLATPHPSL